MKPNPVQASITRVVGIGGTRNSLVDGKFQVGYPKTQVIKNFVSSLPQDHTCMVVSGGASGVDTVVIETAIQLKMPYAVIPYAERLGPFGGKFRNILLDNFVYEFYAFWNLASRGTKHAIQLAQSSGKLRNVYGPDGEILDKIW